MYQFGENPSKNKIAIAHTSNNSTYLQYFIKDTKIFSKGYSDITHYRTNRCIVEINTILKIEIRPKNEFASTRASIGYTLPPTDYLSSKHNESTG